MSVEDRFTDEAPEEVRPQRRWGLLSGILGPEFVLSGNSDGEGLEHRSQTVILPYWSTDGRIRRTL